MKPGKTGYPLLGGGRRENEEGRKALVGHLQLSWGVGCSTLARDMAPEVTPEECAEGRCYLMEGPG